MRRAKLPHARACTCASCADVIEVAEIDPDAAVAEFVTDLLAGAEMYAGSDDPLGAEVAGAGLTTMFGLADGETVARFLGAVVPRLEAVGGRNAAAILRAIGTVATGQPEDLGRACAAASAAADRLTAAGVPEPPWVAELAAPMTVDTCQRLTVSGQADTVLLVSFTRAGRGHAFFVFVDGHNCGAATDAVMVTGADVARLLDAIHDDAGAIGAAVTATPIDPAQLHWYVADALESRAVHDEEGPLVASLLGGDGSASEDDADYPAMAALLRRRLRLLPPPRRPAGARPHTDHGGTPLTALEVLTNFANLVSGAGGPGAALGRASGRFGPLPLPPKRTRRDGAAPILQLKIGLRGAKPPIWRRLLVPGDLSLAALHAAILTCFDWNGSHLHVFETPYGAFGMADADLGHRPDSAVTLEQVAREPKDKIRYTYDFGDDWVHDIVVEKVLDPDPALRYPRCTGGRRAAPPDDCGGIWGYGELVEVLADPSHPEHQTQLEWLGLTDAARFDPATFDLETINALLVPQRSRRR